MEPKRLLSTFTLIGSILALRVTPGSPCTSVCQPNSTETTPLQISCTDDSFNVTGSVGGTFQDCISCELQSTYSDASTLESDVGWGLYNLRYAFSACVYAFPEQISNISTPCVVSCTPLQPALQLDLTTPDPKTYNEFCTNSAFADNSVSTCEYCYALSSEQAYMANFLEAVRYNCHFQTPLGDAFAIAPSRIFNSTELPTTTTAITPSATSTSAPHVITNLVIIILFPIIGFLILLALLALCCFCVIRRQRRKLRERNRTQNLHTRWNDTTMSTPPIGSWSHPLTTYSPQIGMATPGFSPGFGHAYEFQNLHGRNGDIKSGFSNPSSPVEPWNPFPVQAHYYQPEKITEPQEPLYFPPPPPKASR